MAVKIEAGWKAVLKEEFDKPYFQELLEFVRDEYKNQLVFPPGPKIFAAFDHTPFENVKVVIIGQDPYHGPRQAHGLSFSVPEGIAPPPSLLNIFQELKTDVGRQPTENGNLEPWAQQGVLLLNAVLTVRAYQAASHQRKGWEQFTDTVIQKLNEEREGLVFMLWGGFAKKKGKHIDRERHLVLESGHPSPLSANRGYWFGNKHFSQANEYLIEKGKAPIDW